eukprot:COSAG01_NODE_744_length_13876_cov_4.660449_23_plen_178_part_00
MPVVLPRSVATAAAADGGGDRMPQQQQAPCVSGTLPIESPCLQLTSECQRCSHPPRLNNWPLAQADRSWSGPRSGRARPISGCGAPTALLPQRRLSCCRVTPRRWPTSGEPNAYLDDAPCPPFTIHGASIRQPFGAGAAEGRGAWRVRGRGAARAATCACGTCRRRGCCAWWARGGR